MLEVGASPMEPAETARPCPLVIRGGPAPGGRRSYRPVDLDVLAAPEAGAGFRAGQSKPAGRRLAGYFQPGFLSCGALRRSRAQTTIRQLVRSAAGDSGAHPGRGQGPGGSSAFEAVIGEAI